MTGEPPSGAPESELVLVAVRRPGGERFATVEQDVYPWRPDRPPPGAVRTRKSPRSRGA
ncbi:hypothetical protein ACWD3Z_34590 [Streptomyces sp. NPDC002740]